MIYEVEGDVLLTKAQAIAHGIAAKDPMDRGLARNLHEQYPAMHKDFHHWCNQTHAQPGTAWLWGGAGGVRIVNLITQEGGYGHGARPGKATTAHVNHALRALKKIIGKETLSSVAIPRLATGVGGLEWKEVKPLIQNQLGELEIPVFVYVRYVPDQQAHEMIT